ncbi:protein phosphatase Slingshot homolog 2b isoform X2 [Engraulis encrasicolus]|uniref:protein phosphatase Slingshot homolog 2b isoform X2 n=1 Tax=Engraulis encrasicolus TaxID=184585 RepID=UPI002FD03377
MALVTVQRSPTPSTTSSPCVSESGSGEEDRRSQPRSISESFLTVKGAALFLPRGNGSPSSSRVPPQRSKHAGDLQQHLQNMFTLLRPEDNIKLAVRLESFHIQCTRYMVVVSTNGRQDTEESVVLGMDFSPADSSCSIGMVLPLWSDTLIHLDGDGGFSVSTDNRIHVFKPVSVQAMWSALQSLHKACEVARSHNYFPGSLFMTWVSYYQSRIASDQGRINEWNAMQDVQSTRPDSPLLFSDVPTERERTERLIKTRLREIMMQKDLENVTSKEIRTELEMQMTCNLREFKEYIDNEMIVILGQMDSPTAIFDHVFLGSEWNASNLEELQNSGVQYILNVTREIDNFFPGMFEYHNIRVYDEEATDLLAYWNDTYKFISRAKKAGAKCLVHCKMGVSRSAATVIAYAMKEYGWELQKAHDYVKQRRTVTKPNPSFMRQLEEYQGILLASKQRHNKLWRSHSDGNLSEHHEPLVKPTPGPFTLGRSNPRNQSCTQPSPSLQEFLQSLVPVAAAAAPQPSTTLPGDGGGGGGGGEKKDAARPLSNGFCEPRERCRSAPAQTLVQALPQPKAQAQAQTQVPSQAKGPSQPQPHPLAPSPHLLHPQLPQPRAATITMPEAAQVTVVETVPVVVGRPHPPPAIHHLPPSPVPAVRVPRPVSAPPGAASLTVPDGNASGNSQAQVSQATGKAARNSMECPKTGPSTQVPDGKSSQATCNPATFFIGGADADAEGSEGGSGDHLSAMPEQAKLGQAKPASSVDHIDFFSAREKFQGLAQEGPAGGCCPSELLIQQLQQQLSPQDRSPGLPIEQAAAQEASDTHRDHHSKEAAGSMHTVDSGAHSTACQSNSCQANEGAEEAGLKRAEEEEEPGTAVTSAEEGPHQPAAAAGGGGDRPEGTVRRATRELEQRLRQELDVPPAPATASAPHSPPRRSPVHLFPRDRVPDDKPPSPEQQRLVKQQDGTGTERDGGDGGEGEDGSKVAEDKTYKECAGSIAKAAAPQVLKELKIVSSTSSPLPAELIYTDKTPKHTTSTNTTTTPPTLSSTDYPPPSSKPDLTVAAPISVLHLDGVTSKDSSTDKDGGREKDAGAGAGLFGPRTEAELQEAWEMLKELGAFLWQVRSVLEATGLGHHAWLPGNSSSSSSSISTRRAGRIRDPRERAAREAEARLRQAGLTPPSPMKRSASLAKLGSLELTANDLGQWDFDTTPTPTSTSDASPTTTTTGPGTVPRCSPPPPPPQQQHADDSSKKKRVQPQPQPQRRSSSPSTPPTLSPSSPSSPSSMHPHTGGRKDSGDKGWRCHRNSDPTSTTSTTTATTVPGSATATSRPAVRRSSSGVGKAQDSIGHAPPPQSAPPTLISVATRQQYGRTHPLRRLKKRTVSFLYHTV